MERESRFGFALLAWVSMVSLGTAAWPQAAPSSAETTAPWKPVEEALGRSGTVQPDGAWKVSMPRNDLKVTVAGVPIQAGLALGSWIAFSSPGGDSVMTGDLVLTENEVAPVMAELEQAKIEVAALHNHLMRESPRVMYMHVATHGDASRLAQGVAQALELTGTPRPGAPAAAEKLDLDTEKIDRVLGRKGKPSGGVYQFSIARAETIRDHGIQIPASMGVSTAINFQSTEGGHAVVTGDFVLVGSEVKPVIEELSAHGIEITALHSHMLEEEPRLFFMHFWADAEPERLAEGLRAALDQTNIRK
jgi:hypothetical protein